MNIFSFVRQEKKMLFFNLRARMLVHVEQRRRQNFAILIVWSQGIIIGKRAESREKPKAMNHA